MRHVPTATKMRKVAYFRSSHLTFLKISAFLLGYLTFGKTFPKVCDRARARCRLLEDASADRLAEAVRELDVRERGLGGDTGPPGQRGGLSWSDQLR